MSDKISIDEFKAFFEGFVFSLDKNHDPKWDMMLKIVRRVKGEHDCPKFDPSCG